MVSFTNDYNQHREKHFAKTIFNLLISQYPQSQQPQHIFATFNFQLFFSSLYMLLSPLIFITISNTKHFCDCSDCFAGSFDSTTPTYSSIWSSHAFNTSIPFMIKTIHLSCLTLKRVDFCYQNYFLLCKNI